MIAPALGMQVQCEWGLSDTQANLLTSAVFAGQTIGAPIWGALSDARGRKTALFVSIGLTAVFSLGSSFAPTYAVRRTSSVVLF